MIDEEKHEYRYWILAIGGLLTLLGDGSAILTTIGVILAGVAAFQIYEVLKARKSS